ncbi:autotransporter family protein [Pseudomonas putida]
MHCPRLMLCSLLPMLFQEAHAACVLAPTAANDTYVCDSGTATGLTDLLGNNTLTLPVGGTGSIIGNVALGPGSDRVQVDSGSITGNVDQGAAIDTFIMTGGSIGSLSQGDGRDQFVMSGGTIVGAFEDGDVARFSGGTIGRVDMKLDNNVFVMTGGTILGNLVTGLGQDTISVSGGRIGGNISVSGGADVLTVTGGEVGGQVLMSVGNDRFTWDGGGTIKGVISMGDGDDTARLANLDETILGSTPALLGNLGNDTLIFDHSVITRANRYLLWETVSLINGSTLDLADTLTLGDPGSQTGRLNIDASSLLGSTNGLITAAVAGQNVTVTNAGVLDLTRAGTATANQLTIVGNYSGDNGQLHIQSVLAGDDAPSDRLIVSQGTVSGTTTLNVTNMGGLGALTTLNGIQVVEANLGATSSDTAFSLANSLSAGAYQHYLFKGGVTAGSENSWYLRSSVVAPALPVAAAPVTPTEPTAPTAPATPVTPSGPAAPAASAPVAAPGTPVLPVAAPGESIPLYRVEVPVYAAAPPAAALLAQTMLGTFHERQGDQAMLDEHGALADGWARTFGSQLRQHWSGAAGPSVDGSVGGYQVGHDLFAAGDPDGYHQHIGLFVSHARLSGDVKGFALGFQGQASGNISLEGDSLGAYWTLITPGKAYIDAVLMGTHFDGQSRSIRGWSLDLKGYGTSASVETGYPVTLSAHWSLEPQAQLSAQKIQLDSASDPVSRISFDAAPWWRARLGARLVGSYQAFGMPIQPWLRANLWRTLGGTDSLIFDDNDRLNTDHRASTVELGGGVSAKLSRDVSVNLSLGYSRTLDSDSQRALSGSVGIRVSW